MDLTDSIVPRSDQMNAEDLLTGPRTFTVTEVRQGSTEQPVNIYLAEFDPKRPFKPSKTVRRILVLAWGADTTAYTGRRMTLYRDPTVRFGGLDVGGIRVSHLSHIKGTLTMALTVTKGRRAPFVVEPLPDDASQGHASPGGITPDQEAIIGSQMLRAGIDRERIMDLAQQASGREVAKSRELSSVEADGLIVLLTELPDAEE